MEMPPQGGYKIDNIWMNEMTEEDNTLLTYREWAGVKNCTKEQMESDEKHTFKQWEDIKALEDLNRYEDGKLVSALHGFMRAQLEELYGVIWNNPEWEKMAMQRRYRELPRLALVVGSKDGPCDIIYPDVEAILKE